MGSLDSRVTMVKNTKLALVIDVLQATLNKGGLHFIFSSNNSTSLDEQEISVMDFATIIANVTKYFMSS